MTNFDERGVERARLAELIRGARAGGQPPPSGA